MRVGFRWPDGDGLGGGRIDSDSARADGDDASTEIRPLGDTHQAARPDAEFQHAQHMPFIHAYAGDPHILPYRAFFQRPLADVGGTVFRPTRSRPIRLWQRFRTHAGCRIRAWFSFHHVPTITGMPRIAQDFYGKSVFFAYPAFIDICLRPPNAPVRVHPRSVEYERLARWMR